MSHHTNHRMQISGEGTDNRSSALDRAAVLYARARDRGRRGRLGPALNGRSRCLLTLGELETGGDLGAQPCAGVQMVPISQVQGSEGRTGDFDPDFNPLQDRYRQRWLNVAVARQRGKTLPPVELIQVGEIYFVRDGHHRLSVARALGQQTIEARVLIWQVAGPLPWQVQASGREVSLGRFLTKVQAGIAWLQEGLPLGLRSLSNAVALRLRTWAAALASSGSG